GHSARCASVAAPAGLPAGSPRLRWFSSLCHVEENRWRPSHARTAPGNKCWSDRAPLRPAPYHEECRAAPQAFPAVGPTAGRTRPARQQGDDKVTVQAQTPKTVSLTDVAATKVKSLLDQEGRDDLRLRVAVQPGGCSGLRYQLFFDERSLEGDVVTVFPVGAAADDDRQRAAAGAVVVAAGGRAAGTVRAGGGGAGAPAPPRGEGGGRGGVA